MIWIKSLFFRGLKRRLLPSLCARVPSEPRLPSEIFHEVALHLGSLWGVSNLSLVSKDIHRSVLPVLYRSLHLTTVPQCIKVLMVLQRNQQLCVFIRQLVVCPDTQNWATFTDVLGLGKSWFCETLETLLSMGLFSGLHKFLCQGSYTPPDKLWLTLRNNCPQLRHIGCTSKPWVVTNGSHIFSFNDLESFSIQLPSRWFRKKESRAVVFATNILTVVPPPLPRMWEMLLMRCPNLQTLEIDALWFSEVEGVIRGRWAKLHTLRVGFDSIRGCEFMELLLSHPSITELEVPLGSPAPLPVNGEVPNPNLSALTINSCYPGFNMAALSYFRFLRYLDINHDPSSYDVDVMGRVCTALRGLVLLETLRLRYWPSVGRESVAAFGDILAACPALTRFNLFAFSSFNMTELSMAMKRAVKLTFVMITKVLRVRDGNLNRNAKQIFRDNCQLRSLVLRQGLKSRLIQKPPVFTQECMYDVHSECPEGRKRKLEIHVVEIVYKDGARSTKRYRRDPFA